MRPDRKMAPSNNRFQPTSALTRRRRRTGALGAKKGCKRDGEHEKH